MKRKWTYVFSITPFYRGRTVWSADAETKEVIGHSRLWFDKGVTIQDRYQRIVEWLKHYKIECPPYEAGRRR